MGPGFSRLNELRKRMSQESMDGLLITKETNWRYLSGFKGDAGALLLTEDKAYVFTDSRYIEEAQRDAVGFRTVMTVIGEDKLRKTLDALNVKTLGFESHSITHAVYEDLKKRFSGIALLGIRGWVEDLRVRKKEEEVNFIKKAQNIADEAFLELLDKVRVGVSEKELALEFEFNMRRKGAEGLSFPMIAVTGERSSLPHGVPIKTPIKSGDFITFDFGAKYEGYCSDCTRTLIVGHCDEKHREIYETVLRANLEGLKAVKPGVRAKDVDEAGREVIRKAGYGEYFGHGIGHGVGLDIHELPTLSPSSDAVLEPGMVVTVEPGIYVPGFGGCRIEDLVLVTDTGKEILSECPKDLIVIKDK